ncbi:hypothetical protein BT96DRAFT_1013757 [Gymnopus androsaceus JB14]|uniref:Uncharacterized protein n=1 Tax=Gymnopus androsaceus JB14 TaxID=1447944 RepID=A0A6A4IEY3_9AGAR|nr:hypothetical protein BT96DRAFT_1013757 [Gymnopus androsaceus JB14]
MSDSFSETDSTFISTGSFSSTIPGIGALSGKAIKRFGSVVVKSVDAILIRRRLVQIEDVLGQRSDGMPDSCDIEALYSDLLELAAPSYSLSVRTRAFRLIMGNIAGLEFKALADAVVNWDSLSESCDLLSDMISCLRLEGCLTNLDAPEANILHAAGIDAYKTRLPYTSSSGSSHCIAFLLFVALSVSLSQDSGFSRILMKLDMLQFITDIHPGILEPGFQWSNQLLPAQLVLRALLEKLDSDNDSLYVTKIQKLLSADLPSSRKPIHPKTTESFLMNAPMIALLAQKLRSLPLTGYFPTPSHPEGNATTDNHDFGCGDIISKFLAPSFIIRCSGNRDARNYPPVIDEEQIEDIINEIYDTYLVRAPALPQAPLQVHISVSIEHD